jgi:hypothetical protein
VAAAAATTQGKDENAAKPQDEPWGSANHRRPNLRARTARRRHHRGRASGIYAAEALSQQTDVAVEIAVIDRLPVPFGLVRYGVAPDHHSIRSIRNTLERTLEKSCVSFYGDVNIGADIILTNCASPSMRDLRVRGGYGQAAGIPGEELKGASRLPSWWPGTAAIPTSTLTPTNLPAIV